MFLRIDMLDEKKLVGQRLTMSLVANRTSELWQGFMKHRGEIINKLGTDLYSVQIYDRQYFQNFNPSKQFEKWAATEVPDFKGLSPEMQTLIIPAGLYAVFLHKGPASAGAKTFQYIFQEWLPNADYALDHRPHFELLGEKYNNDLPTSEEEFWIPVKRK
jgi:AraC family transcriptional regulator